MKEREENQMITAGLTSWRSPSNIALVKYWGKAGRQIPANPSLSMTLRQAFTDMKVEYRMAGPGHGITLDFQFEGRSNDEFSIKILEYIRSLNEEMPILRDISLKISSSNTFPHSTGIASSASSMSALALCLATLEQTYVDDYHNRDEFLRRASFLARLASGSACRSIYGGFVLWGEMDGIPGSSDDYGIPAPVTIDPVFETLRDSILVVSKKAKDVSSRAGHSLMKGHPYAEARYAEARRNTFRLMDALGRGDLDLFIEVTEWEALNLHALMMSSDSSYILFEPNTLSIVEEIRAFRKSEGIPLCFTLDAGPNVHMLYPASVEDRIMEWIDEHLGGYCQDGLVIHDSCGSGPEELTQ